MNVQSFNLSSIETKGFDIELGYRMDLDKLGSLTIRALATHVIDNTSNSGAPARSRCSSAGSNIGSTPDWKAFVTQSWDFQKIGIDLTERWISDGTIGNQYIECQTNCPASHRAGPRSTTPTWPARSTWTSARATT